MNLIHQKTLADKLWEVVRPVLQLDQPRDPGTCIYRIENGAPAALRQAEGLLVALDASSLRDAFTALLAAERWGALVQHNTNAPADLELKALLLAATTAASERIAFSLPERPKGDETVSFKLIQGGG